MCDCPGFRRYYDQGDVITAKKEFIYSKFDTTRKRKIRKERRKLIWLCMGLFVTMLPWSFPITHSVLFNLYIMLYPLLMIFGYITCLMVAIPVLTFGFGKICNKIQISYKKVIGVYRVD
jgi:hypothetical protein